MASRLSRQAPGNVSMLEANTNKKTVNVTIPLTDPGKESENEEGIVESLEHLDINLNHKERSHSRNMRDTQRYARKQSNKQRKKRKKARREGMQPQSGEVQMELDVEVEKIISRIKHSEAEREDFNLELPTTMEKINAMLKKYVDARRPPDATFLMQVREKFASSLQELQGKSTTEKVLDAVIKMLSFSYLLSLQTSQKGIITLFVHEFLHHISIGDMSDLYALCHNHLMPEGGLGEEFDNMRSKVQLISYNPIGQFIFKVATVAMYFGLQPSKSVSNQKLQNLLEAAEENIFPKTGEIKLLDMLLDIASFCLNTIDKLRKGIPVEEMIFPDALQTQIVNGLIEAEALLEGLALYFDNEKFDKSMANLNNLADRVTIKMNQAEAKQSKKVEIYLMSSLTKIKKTIEAMEVAKNAQEKRPEPYAIAIFGPSQIGKSFLTTEIREACGSARKQGPFPPGSCIAYSDGEKFDDCTKNSTKVVVFDDVGATKISTSDPALSSIGRLVKAVNNVPQPTNQSDVSRKGKIFYNYELIMCTSNLDDFGVREIYNTPIAALNRLHCYEAQLVEEYATHAGTLNLQRLDQRRAELGREPGHLKIRSYMWKSEGPKTVSKHYTSDWMDQNRFISQVATQYKLHQARQNDNMNRYADRNTASRCDTCFLIENGSCTCTSDHKEKMRELFDKVERKKKDLEPEFGFLLNYFPIDEFCMNLHFRLAFLSARLNTRLGWLATRLSVFTCSHFVRGCIVAFVRLENIERRIMGLCLFTLILFSTCDLLSIFMTVMFLVACFLITGLSYGRAVVYIYTQDVLRSFIERNKKCILISTISIVGIATCIRQLLAARDMLYSSQSDEADRSAEKFKILSDPTGEQIEKRRSEYDIWQRTQKQPTVYAHRLKTMTFQQILERIPGVFGHASTATEIGTELTWRIHFFGDRFGIMPLHSYKRLNKKHFTVNVKMQKSERNLTVCNAYIPHSDSGETDIVFLQFTGMPACYDSTHMLTDEKYSGVAWLVRISIDGKTITHEEVYTQYEAIKARNPEIPKFGYTYEVRNPTQAGECGSLLITKDKPHRLLGYHCAGSNGSCVAAIMKKSWVESMRMYSLTPEGNMIGPMGFGTEIETCPYGEEELLEEDFTEKSFVTYFPSLVEKEIYPICFSPKQVTKPHSCVEYTSLKQPLEELGVPIKYGPPRLLSNRDHCAALESATNGMSTINPALLAHAIEDFVVPLEELVRRPDYPRRQMLNIDETLNGIKGNRFANQIDGTTSSGFGKRGPKEETFLVKEYLEDGTKHYTLNDLGKTEYDRVLEKFRRGQRENFVVKTALKDEPVKLDDNGHVKKNTRVFYTIPCIVLLVMRSLFIPLNNILMDFPFISECAAGINAFNDEWGSVFTFLTQDFGPDRVVEGDYKSWDLSVNGQLLRAIGICYMRLAMAMGYPPEDVAAIGTIFSEIAATYVCFNGAVLLAHLIQISGILVTLHGNCIGNSLLKRCCFFSRFFEGTYVLPKDLFFRDYVKLICQGDDCLYSSLVMDARDEYEFCKSINLGFTDAHKNTGDAIIPYQNIFQVTFCKRSFTYHEVLQRIVAPLDVNSIHKSLYCWKKGKIDMNSFLVQNLHNAMFELTRHGEVLYEFYRKLYLEAFTRIDKDILVKKILTRPYSYMCAELMDRFYVEKSTETFDDISDIEEDFSVSDYLELQSQETLDRETMYIPFYKVLGDTTDYSSLAWNNGDVLRHLVSFYHEPAVTTLHAGFSTNYRVMFTGKQLNKKHTVGVMSVSNTTSPWTSSVEEKDLKLSEHQHTMDTNDGFFSRPVRVASYRWETGVSFFRELNPWRAFCEDPRISNRLAHFANLKMRLKVQFFINGNPFYYGRMIASYVPLPNSDERTNFSPGFADLVEMSQRNHVYMDPTTSEGGELDLPFIWPKSTLDIIRGDWRSMGIIQIKDLSPLFHANGSTDAIVITVVVSAYDVDLSTPTSLKPIDLQPQSGEYGSVSEPAAKIADIAADLSEAPVIGRFAKATEVGARNVSNVAKLFGFSKPRMIPDTMTATSHHTDYATSDTVNTGYSLALLSTKEVTVDPAAVGIGNNDDMSIQEIAKRECFIGQGKWKEGDAVNAHIFSVPISPIHGLIENAKAHISPMAFISVPFSYWKGSIEVRMQVVCSAYHRGRLRVVWDPKYVANSEAFNVNYSSLIDITETTEMSFKIGWGSSLDYLRVPPLFDTLTELPGPFEPGSELTVPGINGILSTFVVNSLTSPSPELTEVTINYFVKACDDFELTVPACSGLSNVVVSQLPSHIPDADLNPSVTTRAATDSVLARSQSCYNNDSTLTTPGNIRNMNSSPTNLWIQAYASYPTNQTLSYKVRSFSTAPATYSVSENGVPTNNIAIAAGESQTRTFVASLKAGWNQIPLAYKVTSDQIIIETASNVIPAGTEMYSYNGTQLQTLLPGATLGTFNNGQTYAVIQTSTRMKIPGYTPGSYVNIFTDGPSVINGITYNSTGSQHTDPLSICVVSVKPKPDGYLYFDFFPANEESATRLYKMTVNRAVDLTPQSAEEARKMRPGGKEPDEVMGPSSSVKGLNNIYFGEQIASVRTMLARYITYYTLSTGNISAQFYWFDVPHYPLIPISNTTGVHTMNTIPSIFQYIVSAYVCMRGGMRLGIVRGETPGTSHMCMVTRKPLYATPNYTVQTAVSTSTFRPRISNWCGTTHDIATVRPMLEYELPYYSNLKFTSGRSTLALDESKFIERPSYTVEPNVLATRGATVLNYSIAEDFSLSYFLSTPLLDVPL